MHVVCKQINMVHTVSTTFSLFRLIHSQKHTLHSHLVYSSNIGHLENAMSRFLCIAITSSEMKTGRNRNKINENNFVVETKWQCDESNKHWTSDFNSRFVIDCVSLFS